MCLTDEYLRYNLPVGVYITGCLNKYALIQYWFDGPQVEVRPKPLGNSKSSSPYFRTAETAKSRHKEIATKNTPKESLQIATREQGGELEAKGLRNIQQMATLQEAVSLAEESRTESIALSSGFLDDYSHSVLEQHNFSKTPCQSTQTKHPTVVINA